MNNGTPISDDKAVKIAYTLWVDGVPIDSADEENPLEYLQGYQNIIPGLEKALNGLSAGEKTKVVIPAEDGYGERVEDSIIELERSMFPEDYELVLGDALHLQDEESDQIFTAYILNFDDEKVKLDLNHPLAGKELTFEVTVVDVRDATEEELAHEHIHSGCASCHGDCEEGGCC